MKFVYEVASLDKVTTRALTGAFIRAHVNFAALEKKDDGILREELSQKSDIEVQDTFKAKQKVVTLEELLKGGTLVE